MMMSYVGDQFCDDGSQGGVNLLCETFSNDAGDCDGGGGGGSGGGGGGDGQACDCVGASSENIEGRGGGVGEKKGVARVRGLVP